jgi:hypothetical protein
MIHFIVSLLKGPHKEFGSFALMLMSMVNLFLKLQNGIECLNKQITNLVKMVKEF